MTRTSILFVVGMLAIIGGAAGRKPFAQAAGAFAILVAFWLAPA